MEELTEAPQRPGVSGSEAGKLLLAVPPDGDFPLESSSGPIQHPSAETELRRPSALQLAVSGDRLNYQKYKLKSQA